MIRLRGLLPCVLAAITAACAHTPDDSVPEGALARVGIDCLTRADLRAAMPAGLSADDSTRFAHAFIRSWIDTRLIDDVAAEHVDMKAVDALVEQYRRGLIMREYSAIAFDAENRDISFSDSVIADYYDKHSADFVLRSPMIRGVYIKLPDEAPNLAAIRRLYRSTKPADIDRLEKSVLDAAIHYDYFRDRWIDWQQVEGRIPYDFGTEPASWLRSNSNLDVSLGGFTYLLQVSEVLPAGSVMPLDEARPVIRERLLAERRRTYDASLRTRLYDAALASGRLRLY